MLYDYNKNKYILCSPIYDFTWKRGLNKSNRDSTHITYDEEYYKNIDFGFHVYEKDKPRSPYGRILMKVTCKQKDFVGCGKNSERVYTQVFITKKEYDRVFKKLRESY